MDQNSTNKFNEELRERTMKMALEVRDRLSRLRIGEVDKPVVNQLIRSSSSVAANYRAASCARSNAEFLAKISIVLEETDESKFWIDYLCRINILNQSESTDLQKEVDELVRIFSSIRKKMKDKLDRS